MKTGNLAGYILCDSIYVTLLKWQMHKNGEEICCCRKSRTEIGVVRRICGGGVRWQTGSLSFCSSPFPPWTRTQDQDIVTCQASIPLGWILTVVLEAGTYTMIKRACKYTPRRVQIRVSCHNQNTYRDNFPLEEDGLRAQEIMLQSFLLLYKSPVFSKLLT